MDTTIIIETILIETGLLYSVIDARNIAMLHKLVTKLHELGIIDDEKYDQIMEDLSTLANCTGEQFVKKAKEIGREIERILKSPRVTTEAEVLKDLHKQIHKLFACGRITRGEYGKLVDELADLANSEGKQFWGNVKRFHEKLYNFIN